jgi:glycosyltransferase involved in cell wall biosynthesis
MKIVFDYSIFFHQKYGGVSRYFINLHNQLLGMNSKAKIFAPIHTNLYLKNYNLGGNFKYYMKKYPIFTRKILKNINYLSSKTFFKFYNPDIVHQTFFENNDYKGKFKKVITVYDLIHEIYFKDYGKSNDYKPKKFSLENSDQIICISNKTKEDLINIYKVDPNKIKVIYLGVSKFPELPKKNTILNQKPYLLFVGDRSKYKNFENLVKAYSSSIKLQNDFDIVCCGGGKLTDLEKINITDRKINLSKIIQLEVDDNLLGNFYRNAVALIYPSKYEGFGLPTLEAMSLGCPVICSKHPAIIETVGNSAKIFDPENFEEIKSCIEDIVYSPSNLEIYKKAGLERCKKFNWYKCAEETLKVYNDLS